MDSQSKPQLLTFNKTPVGTNVASERSEEEGPHENNPLFSFPCVSAHRVHHDLCLFFLRQEREHGVPIVRNAAWNDLIHQVDPSANDSPRETLGKEFGLIQKFLREHQSEVRVGIYDITVFRAIDQARARLQKADKDLETIKNELAYKEVQAKVGR